jgi:hypothetical protein
LKGFEPYSWFPITDPCTITLQSIENFEILRFKLITLKLTLKLIFNNRKYLAVHNGNDPFSSGRQPGILPLY